MLELMVSKLLHPNIQLMDRHGLLFVASAVLMVAGIEFLAIGLLGELQVRHHHTLQKPAPYAVDCIIAFNTAKAKEGLGYREGRQ